MEGLEAEERAMKVVKGAWQMRTLGAIPANKCNRKTPVKQGQQAHVSDQNALRSTRAQHDWSELQEEKGLLCWQAQIGCVHRRNQLND